MSSSESVPSPELAVAQAAAGRQNASSPLQINEIGLRAVPKTEQRLTFAPLAADREELPQIDTSRPLLQHAIPPDPGVSSHDSFD